MCCLITAIGHPVYGVYYYLQPTYPIPQHKPHTILNNNAPGLTVNLSILHDQKPPNQFRSSVLNRSPQLYAPILPVSLLAPVARNHSFCSWVLGRQGAAITYLTTRQENKTTAGNCCIHTYLLPTRIAVAGISAVTITGSGSSNFKLRPTRPCGICRLVQQIGSVGGR